MLVHDKTDKTTTTATSEPTALPAGARTAPGRAARRSRRRVWAFAVAAAAGIVAIAAVTQPDQGATDPTSVADGSFDVAEANRMETVRDLVAGPVSGGSSDVAEANRMEASRDLVAGPVAYDSFGAAEMNRMSALRDLVAGP